MKLVSAIMAIYILGLIIVPCADVHAEYDSNKAGVQLIDTHENHVDTCSPFCFCDCCQIVSQPEYHSFTTPSINLFESLVTFYQASEFSIPITFWRPPKI